MSPQLHVVVFFVLVAVALGVWTETDWERGSAKKWRRRIAIIGLSVVIALISLVTA